MVVAVLRPSSTPGLTRVVPVEAVATSFSELYPSPSAGDLRPGCRRESWRGCWSVRVFVDPELLALCRAEAICVDGHRLEVWHDLYNIFDLEWECLGAAG